MPSELEELVEFLHHGNTQIRQIAAENLVGYSTAEPAIFKIHDLEPVKDLKLLVNDYAPIAKNALTILVNLSDDHSIIDYLIEDEAFLETLLLRITNAIEPNANEIAMLLSNLAKSDQIVKILALKRAVPKPLSKSEYAIDQLMDCFVKGAEGAYNKHADYDYLSYLFADLAKFDSCRIYFTTPQARDDAIIPLTKLIVFTEHASHIRRRGVASTIKNTAFDIAAHTRLVAAVGTEAIDVLPYILLPLMGPEEYSDEDTNGMLEELQLLPPDKQRESDVEILKTHVETLLLLTTTREARDLLRHIKVYPIVRETHAHIEDEGVREACDRLVQVVMRDEEGEGADEEQARAIAQAAQGRGGMLQANTEHDVDEDDQIVDVL